ncbi:endonuclease/exonuclease/phosphatase family protein [Nocardioides sp. ChNu-153]|uniref:endonuclease/exonuclease/phosphatase family protein n=1 Tax=unclassified Nocardioides TaxID=2615069 RepID=UPI0024057A01|nr:MULTISPECIES: endonuclease/exonuclease/phosphatase family protein [unclassified Nocardioides]MDF9717550.1 endonuclease/exonuclease/phosphatase family protein [Nocardioides sp. ChNu-99]MDN7123137.1 endonuclease/exonuclease/phosphatase family protein [Nocardioides sp. ChNu-153]
MPPVLTLATANAASGRDRRGALGAASWGRWAAAAAALDVDVLAVQEVDHLLPRSGRVDQTAVLAAALRGRERGGAGAPPWHARFAAAVHGTPGSASTFRPAGDDAQDRPDEPSYGVALLSRHPVVAWRELRLGPSRVRLPVPLPAGAGRRVLWVPDEPRVAVAAVVATPAREVAVVTTHLSFSPWRARDQLREVVRWCRDLPRPLVLLGDLNLPGRLAVRAAGMTPALREPTHPAVRPRVQLDHVLLDDPAGVVGVTAAATRRVADSDHLAVRVVLSGV